MLSWSVCYMLSLMLQHEHFQHLYLRCGVNSSAPLLYYHHLHNTCPPPSPITSFITRTSVSSTTSVHSFSQTGNSHKVTCCFFAMFMPDWELTVYDECQNSFDIVIELWHMEKTMSGNVQKGATQEPNVPKTKEDEFTNDLVKYFYLGNSKWKNLPTQQPNTRPRNLQTNDSEIHHQN